MLVFNKFNSRYNLIVDGCIEVDVAYVIYYFAIGKPFTKWITLTLVLKPLHGQRAKL